MKITSPALNNNEYIPAQYTCKGDDINPPLRISNVPDNAISLVIIVDDPDSPNGTWTHWLVWNIDPTTQVLEEDTIPLGATEGTTDFGETGYSGPCPPVGVHRYFFRIFALDTKINLTSEANREELEKAIDKHIVDEAELMGLFKAQR